MLACARIGAIHSVVFGGFAAKELATRIDDCQAEADPVGQLRARARPRRALQAAARRGDRSRERQARGLPHPAAPASRGADDGRAATTTGQRCARRRCCGRSRPTTACRCRDRSALHPLHVGHDRHPERRGARQRRPHGRAQMVDEEPLRRRAGRGLLGGLRRRLGGRPLLHRLRAAVRTAAPRSSTRASRWARPTPARSGASSPSTAASPCSPRRPRSAPSRRRTRRASSSRSTTCRNSAPCSSPASAPIRTRSNGPRSC